MPRNVRNFWLTLDVDGRATRIKTGPVAKDGGFDLLIQQRDAGEIVTGASIRGEVEHDGTITLHIFPKNQHRISVVTHR